MADLDDEGGRRLLRQGVCLLLLFRLLGRVLRLAGGERDAVGFAEFAGETGEGPLPVGPQLAGGGGGPLERGREAAGGVVEGFVEPLGLDEGETTGVAVEGVAGVGGGGGGEEGSVDTLRLQVVGAACSRGSRARGRGRWQRSLWTWWGWGEGE